jgi:NADPH:quinone reductase-like Zn-dependent oxidoreductase
MRALVCAALGDPTLPPGAPGAALELRTLPTPKLGDKDVLIRVAAAALNFADALVVQGCAHSLVASALRASAPPSCAHASRHDAAG